jgi:hypothetical protein
MDDALLVRRFERVGDLSGDGQRLGQRDGAARDVRGEILAFDEFHHQGREVGRLLEAVDRGNVRVVQRGQDFSFTLEPCEAIRVAGDRCGQHLDRDGPLEIAVGGAIDLTHTTRTDLRGDFVGTDVRAGSEGQVALKYMSGTAARSGLLLSHADLFTDA